MSTLEIHQFPCLSDNYGYLVHDPESQVTASIDTPDADAIGAELNRRGWQLTHILNTHHHADHAGGNVALKKRTGCMIVGPAADAARIPGIDVQLGDGDVFDFGGHRIEIYDTPGHTRGHIVYLVPEQGVAFVGDTLFAMGCGRLFEGTPAQMWDSLQKIMSWPEETLLYCAHEYTEANGRFALTVEPGNPELVRRMRKVRERRARGEPTVPTKLAIEKATNPFLRPTSANLKTTIGMPDGEAVAVFAKTRELKDRFR